MRRSVETPSAARSVCYRDVSDMDCFDWDDLKKWVIETVCENWPSMVAESNLWLSNETHVLCANDFAQVTISEYCGCCCVALVPLDDWDGFAPDLSGMARHWCDQIAKKFQAIFNEYERLGVASNGPLVLSDLLDAAKQVNY